MQDAAAVVGNAELRGRDGEGEWKSAKIMCGTIEEVIALVTEAAEMERDS